MSRVLSDASLAARLATLLIVIATGACAQTQLSLDDAVRDALTNHPALAAESQRIASARGLLQQAGLRPNPRLFIQSENWNFSGSPPEPIASTFTDQFLYASQTLETGGKRQRRMN